MTTPLPSPRTSHPLRPSPRLLQSTCGICCPIHTRTTFHHMIARGGARRYASGTGPTRALTPLIAVPGARFCQPIQMCQPCCTRWGPIVGAEKWLQMFACPPRVPHVCHAGRWQSCSWVLVCSLAPLARGISAVARPRTRAPRHSLQCLGANPRGRCVVAKDAARGQRCAALCAVSAI